VKDSDKRWLARKIREEAEVERGLAAQHKSEWAAGRAPSKVPHIAHAQTASFAERLADRIERS
jgi:hypothetical protein